MLIFARVNLSIYPYHLPRFAVRGASHNGCDSHRAGLIEHGIEKRFFLQSYLCANKV